MFSICTGLNPALNSLHFSLAFAQTFMFVQSNNDLSSANAVDLDKSTFLCLVKMIKAMKILQLFESYTCINQQAQYVDSIILCTSAIAIFLFAGEMIILLFYKKCYGWDNKNLIKTISKYRLHSAWFFVEKADEC